MDKASGMGVGQKRQSKEKKCDLGMSQRSPPPPKKSKILAKRG